MEDRMLNPRSLYTDLVFTNTTFAEMTNNDPLYIIEINIYFKIGSLDTITIGTNAIESGNPFYRGTFMECDGTKYTFSDESGYYLFYQEDLLAAEESTGHIHIILNTYCVSIDLV